MALPFLSINACVCCWVKREAMKALPQLNLIVAWLWILLGFVSGLVLGLFFHRENWLGGYASFKRRMYRLGHISFFGLGAVNLLFWLSVKNLPAAGPLAEFASGAFIVGAITMPLCCGLMAHFPQARHLFAIPVLSLIAGAVLTLTVLVNSDTGRQVRVQLKMARHYQSQSVVPPQITNAPPGPWTPNS
jgi:hypothetical protein